MGDAGHRPDEDAITEKVIGCAYAVANAPGFGFLEKVYEKALACELRKTGLHVVHPCPSVA